jgi:acyl-coenzyme A synthetase/AMP-(fatty) acid ligase
MTPIAITNGVPPDNVPVDNEIYLIADDLLQARAADRAQIPLLCFPRTERGVVDFEEFTGKDIDRFVDHAAKYYKECGVQPVGSRRPMSSINYPANLMTQIESSHQMPRVIAILASTDLAYIVTFFALARLGYTILCLSPRLTPIACANLIEETSAFAVVRGKTAQLANLVSQTQELQPVKVIKLVGREDFDKSLSDQPRLQRDNIDREAETNWTLAILHSSGSTGLPKPISLTHKRLMMKLPPPKGQVEFSTFPFFHGYGNWVILHGMLARKMVYVSNPNLPLTADYVVEVLEHLRPDVLHVVPYTLELLAGSQRGLDAMKKCKRVVFSGSGCPDDLGNELVAQGIRIETFWGATEMGALGSSFNRPPEDPTWDYIRIPPPVAKFIWMKPLGDGTYECVYLHGLPALAMSNSDDPPKSYHSKDIFLKHPDMDAWKHIGRLDDRLTLTNGEKVLPIPMEGRIRQNPLIKECCIFGTGRSVPGILIFRNDDSKNMPDQEFIDAIWSTVQHANTHAESFSQISKETIVPLPAHVNYPKTDKESIKRAQIYREFSKDIEAVYEKLENTNTGTLRLDVPQIEDWVMRTFRETLGVHLVSKEDDLFAAGVNSLQTIQMRGLILKELDIGGNSRKCGQNVVFDNANVARLSKHLYTLRVNGTKPDDEVDEIQGMEAMIRKYSNFRKQHVVVCHASRNERLALTVFLGPHGCDRLTRRARPVPAAQSLRCPLRILSSQGRETPRARTGSIAAAES